MEIKQSLQDGAILLGLGGRLDGSTADSLATRLQEVLSGQPLAVILDFADLEYVSSAGLRVLIMAAKQVRTQQTKLALCALQSHVQELFDISGLTQVFTIFPERGAAVQMTARSHAQMASDRPLSENRHAVGK